MTEHSRMEVSMNSEAFTLLKSDMDTIINRTINNMENKGADTATITVKLEVSLEKGSAPADGRDVILPTFKHDISSVMQIKDKMSGTMKGDYELVYDKNTGTYYIRRVDDGQMDIFDQPIVDAEYVEVEEVRRIPEYATDEAEMTEYDYDEPEEE